jgi:hypothetical protein
LEMPPAEACVRPGKTAHTEETSLYSPSRPMRGNLSLSLSLSLSHSLSLTHSHSHSLSLSLLSSLFSLHALSLHCTLLTQPPHEGQPSRSANAASASAPPFQSGDWSKFYMGCRGPIYIYVNIYIWTGLSSIWDAGDPYIYI